MLLCFSSNHHNAEFDLLEKLSVGAAAASDSLLSSGGLVGGAVVLATCNRFEAYLDIEEPAAAGGAVERVLAALAGAAGVDPDALQDSMAIYTDDDVAGHLFAVTSGLESVIVGEEEISGQVARALTAARKAGTSSPALERLFQRASHTSRGVRTSTGLTGTNRSLVRVALEMVSSRVPDWSKVRVLVVGTGRYAVTTMTALRDRGAIDLRSFSPSGNVAPFALRNGAKAERHLAEAIADSDIVITCTTSLAVRAEHFQGGARRIVVDLGLPRNVEHAVGELAGVELLDLETIRLHAPLDLLAPTSDARSLVGDAAARFAADEQIEPAIIAMRTHLLDILEAEIKRAKKRGDETGEIEAALRHLVSVLVHTPSVRARELAVEGRAGEFVDALDALYGIRVEPASALEVAANPKENSATA